MKNPIKTALLLMIRLYQRTLSPDTGWFSPLFPNGYCRFHPTCSEYTHRAIASRGVVVGIVLGSWRILRCNPFSKGGVDQVPEKKSKSFSIIHNA